MELAPRSRRNQRGAIYRLRNPGDVPSGLPISMSYDPNVLTAHSRSRLEKWGKYLRAPSIFFKIDQHPKMVKLEEIAKIRRGFTTGASDFFYLDKERIRLWNIEKDFVKPVVTSPKDVGVEVKPEDINQWVLMVHEPKEEMSKKNANVQKYIEWGENVETRIKGGTRGGTVVKGYHNLSTVKSRKTWYSLSERKPAPILRSRRIWERCVYTLNRASAQANDSFYEARPNSKEDTVVLTGILNSSVTALLSELHGRFYGGGVLELEVYESKRLPVLDPSKLSIQERKNIEASFLKLCEMQRKGDKKGEREARKELDNAVFDALGLTENERRKVYAGLKSLRQMRLQRKEVEVLVETPEKWKPPSKRKKKSKLPKEPSKRLDLWMREA